MGFGAAAARLRRGQAGRAGCSIYDDAASGRRASAPLGRAQGLPPDWREGGPRRDLGAGPLPAPRAARSGSCLLSSCRGPTSKVPQRDLRQPRERPGRRLRVPLRRPHPWAERGVLLLNTALTVEAQVPNSHRARWTDFTDAVLRRDEECDNVVFLLSGRRAIDRATAIHISDAHKVIRSAPGSPRPEPRGPLQGRSSLLAGQLIPGDTGGQFGEVELRRRRLIRIRLLLAWAGGGAGRTGARRRTTPSSWRTSTCSAES